MTNRVCAENFPPLAVIDIFIVTFVVRAVNAQYARHVHLRSALGCDAAHHAPRREYGFAEFVTLQDFVVHLVIARGVSGVAARYIHHDGSVGLAGGRIESHRSAFQLERAMRIVNIPGKQECDVGVRRIKFNDRDRSSPRRQRAPGGDREGQ